MGAVVLDNGRIRMVLAMFQITQGELARASCTYLWGKPGKPACWSSLSEQTDWKVGPTGGRTAVALIHGLEKLLTDNRRMAEREAIPCLMSFSATVRRGFSWVAS